VGCAYRLYRYSQFCEHYRRWLWQRGATMRHVHQSGEKTFADYLGQEAVQLGREDGERIDVDASPWVGPGRMPIEMSAPFPPDGIIAAYNGLRRASIPR
jgi:hypothetical protein